MRIRKKKWAMPELLACGFFMEEPQVQRGRWREAFADPTAPMRLEVGCGKGSFTAEMAIAKPEINFLGIDLIDDMLGVAQRNIRKRYQEENRPIDNIRLTVWDIERLPMILDEADQFERIYINFCNPWPKAKHRKKRLTHPKQLALYRPHLKEEGEIWFKTDSDLLFNDSITYFKESGFEISYLTYDLHHADFPGFTPMTEHERMFTEEGIPTKFLIAKKGTLPNPPTPEPVAFSEEV